MMKIDLSDYKQVVIELPYDEKGRPWSKKYFEKYGCVLTSISEAFNININDLINMLISEHLINEDMSIGAANIISLLVGRGFVKKKDIAKIYLDCSPTGYHYVCIANDDKTIFSTFKMKVSEYKYELK
jgi:hypothetical protein